MHSMGGAGFPTERGTAAAAAWPRSPCMPQGNLPGDRASALARPQSSPHLTAGPYPLQACSRWASCKGAETARDRSAKSWSTAPGPGQMPGCSRLRAQRRHRGPRETSCTPPAQPPKSRRPAGLQNKRTSLHQACDDAASPTPPAGTSLLGPRHSRLRSAPNREDRCPRPRETMHAAHGVLHRERGLSS